MKKHRAALLERRAGTQASHPARANSQPRTTTESRTSTLDQQKLADNQKTQKVLAQLKQVEANINKDLAAGLITQGDAATQLAALNQAQGAYTDSKIAELLLTDSVLDKTTTGTASLNVLVKQAELRSEVAQLDVAINVAEKQLQEETRRSTACTRPSPRPKEPRLSNASGQQRLYFAFVPYDNQADAVIGSAVDRRHLNMIVCRKVGSVKRYSQAKSKPSIPSSRLRFAAF